jgi:hypothetical protein
VRLLIFFHFFVERTLKVKNVGYIASTVNKGRLTFSGGKNMGDRKNFVLMENGDDTTTVFSSRQPRGAALKAASRGFTDIRLRERGTNRVHVFTGKREQVSAPSNAPGWLGNQVWKPNVKKQGVERI